MQKLTLTAIMALALGACHTTVVVNNTVIQAPEASTTIHRPEPPPSSEQPLTSLDRAVLGVMRNSGLKYTKAKPVFANGVLDAPRVGGIRGYAPELAQALATIQPTDTEQQGGEQSFPWGLILGAAGLLVGVLGLVVGIRAWLWPRPPKPPQPSPAQAHPPERSTAHSAT